MNGDKRIFEGLEISKETALCGEHMGKYPVISISLKGMDALTYETAFQMAVQIVIEAAEKFYFLLDSEKLKEHDKAEYRKLLDDHMNEGMLCSSLRKLSGLLEKHYGTKAVLLIDEYDILNCCDSLLDDKEAQPENYWINTSSNDAVKRFIQESANATTKREIERLVAGEVIMKEIHQELTYSEIYQTIDNIWSLLFTTGYLTQRGKAEGRQMKLAIPNMEIRDIFVTQIMEFFKENVREDGDTLNRFCDALQNEDTENVEKIFAEYLRKTISIRDTAVRTDMKENLPTGKATTKETKGQSPSVCFYHGVLLGILSVKNRWGISSNREMGEGYADILAEPDTGDMGIIIEVKYAHDGDLDGACKEALKQIEYTRYEDDLSDDGVENILKYGIACYKKRCRVMLAQK